MLRLYDSRMSGNSWKIRILLSQLQLPYERVTLDIAQGETRTPAFRHISRFARVPVLELEDGRCIAESGAILAYLAEGTPLLPTDPWLRAEVLGWMFFEQADLQKPLALPRVYHLHGQATAKADEIAGLHQHGYAALAPLEAWVEDRDWLVGERYTLADLAVSVYVSLADQGGYDMARFGAIRRWTARVAAQPGWVPLLPAG
jgi:glutathione S-transferase